MKDKEIKSEATSGVAPEATNDIPQTSSAAEVSTGSAGLGNSIRTAPIGGVGNLSPEASVPVIEVPVDKLQGIMDRMDGFDAQLKAKDAEIEALNQTVSSTRLAEAKANMDVDKRGRVHFKKIDGKTVIGWPSAPSEKIKNEIVFNPATNLPMGEILKSVYYFADGTESEMVDQIKLTRSTDRAHARILQDEGDYVVVEFEDKAVLDKPLRVHKSFLNA